MKNKVLQILISFAFICGCQTGVILTEPPFATSLTILCIGASALILLFALYSFISYTRRLNALLMAGVNEHSKNHLLQSFDRLETNIRTTKKKLDLSATYISKLDSDPSVSWEIDGVLRHDKLGMSLLNMHKKMTHLREEEEKRTWITSGITKFSEILRNKSELSDYGLRIISGLVKYLRANQGALYIECTDNDDSRCLDLVACYAYDKKKYHGQRICEGDGLLGQSMYEKEIIYITDVPAEYVKITSGLGESLPRGIVIAPLVFNDQFYGTIEIATFNKLESHHFIFLREVLKNVASELASIKAHQQTQKLLHDSTQLAEELRDHDREMKQHLYELAKTQEEMARKQSELNSYLSAINNTIASVEFDLDGCFKAGNEIFLKVMGYTERELIGMSYKKFMSADLSLEMMWDNLKVGKFFSGEFKMRSKKGKEMWLSGTFNPITVSGNVPEKVMMFAQFTTQEKERISDLNEVVHAVKASVPMVEFHKDFTCKSANEKFLSLAGISRIQLKSKSIYDLMVPSYADFFKTMHADITKSELSTLLIPMKVGQSIVTYETSLSIIRDANQNINRIILIFIKSVEETVREEVVVT